MALVSYSSSEDSEREANVAPQQASKPPSAPGKPGFQKVVNRSNPRKIEVHLPEFSKSSAVTADDAQEPSTKRIRLGGGTTSDFNSFLPAPKRVPASHGTSLSKGTGRGESGSTISLKTGANPGFSREAPQTAEPLDTASDEPRTADIGLKSGHETEDHKPNGGIPLEEDSKREAPKKGNLAMFKPLSVARKPKKKTQGTRQHGELGKDTSSAPASAAATGKQPSLFFAGGSPEVHGPPPPENGLYQPMLYEPADVFGEGAQGLHANQSNSEESINTPAEKGSLEEEGLHDSKNSHETSQSLDTIAADLNLSASARRQLFGRYKNNIPEVNVVNFDTDREYAANELLRQAGEQAQHNPVRSIAPGKHSLKQLVSAASHQKDALEEHFASGRRNKKEAGSKYGW